MNNDASDFGFKQEDWVCPVCQTEAQKPVVACPNCGCHLLLLVKIRRVHDDYIKQNKLGTAQAFYRPKTP